MRARPEVTWLPGQALDRNTAITAMILADVAAKDDLHEGHRLWPHGPYLELSQYEQLIAVGIAAADAKDRPVDDVTARRLAIWLAARRNHRSSPGA